MTKVRPRARKIGTRIFVRDIFALQFRICPHLAGYRGFITRVWTNGSGPIILVRPSKPEPNN
jgi:hypothetical protein